MWGITAKYLKDKLPKVAAKIPFNKDIHPIDFNETYHKSFCAELKMLYTVVTRAKRHIWIYEDFPPEKLPMLEYWYKRDLIRVDSQLLDNNCRGLDVDIESTLHESSTDEWKKQGDIYMERSLWHAAKKCYQKANDQYLVEVAHALVLKKEALTTKSVGIPQFCSVAAQFIKCCELVPRREHLKNCAIFLYHAKMYTESIQLLEKIEEVRSYLSPIYTSLC